MAVSPIRGGLLLSSVDGPVPERRWADRPRGDHDAPVRRAPRQRRRSHGCIAVRWPKDTVPFRVVSRISFPVLGGVVGLGRGAALTVAGYKAAVCPAGPGRQTCLRALQSGPASGGLLGKRSGRSAGTSSSQLLPARLPIDNGAPDHADVSRQLRRSSQLPSDLRWDVGFVGGSDARPFAGGERHAPAARRSAFSRLSGS